MENEWFEKWIIDRVSFSFSKRNFTHGEEVDSYDPEQRETTDERAMKWLMADCSSVLRREEAEEKIAASANVGQ